VENNVAGLEAAFSINKATLRKFDTFRQFARTSLGAISDDTVDAPHIRHPPLSERDDVDTDGIVWPEDQTQIGIA